MIDSHAHLDHPRFEADLEAQLANAGREGVTGWVIAGVDPRRHRLRRDLHTRLKETRLGAHARFAVGIHPYLAREMAKADDWKRIERELFDQAADLQAVAIGETGFDRSTAELGESLPQQERAFSVCSRVARELELPLIVHVVRAEGELIRAHKACGALPAGGVIHGFTGSPESADQFLRRGFLLSFGPALLRRAPDSPMARAAALIPLDRILVETDAPDQTSDLTTARRVLEAVARIRRADPHEMDEIVKRNAQSLFRCSFEP